MKFSRLAWICLVVLMVHSGNANAADDSANRDLQFLNALQQEGYLEYSLLYLQQLEARTDLPEELRQVLPLEKALTLLQEVRISRNAIEQHKKLNDASAALQQFLEQTPDHPRAAQANSELGSVLLEKGKVEIRESLRTANRTRKPEIQKQAQEHFKMRNSCFPRH